jgi:hypothetical protein
MAGRSEGIQMYVAGTLPANTSGNPPRASLAFRVGVVGHRPDRLDNADIDQLAKVISTILSVVKETTLAFPHHCKAQDCKALYDGADPVLRAISALAEGTDRIFAEQALELRFELCCVLPFPHAEFEKDFAKRQDLGEDVSLTEFRGLLAQASARFELDGVREDESEAYGAGGRVLLNQSDLLIVVWDGQRLGKGGGTEETFDEALKCGVPIAWIDAHSPHHWQLLDAVTPLPRASAGQRVAPDDSGSIDVLRNWVREALELPKLDRVETKKDEDKSTDPKLALMNFYAEQRPRWTPGVVWEVFQKVVGESKWPEVEIKLGDFEEAVSDEWPKDQSTPIARLVDTLRPFYAWPDRLGELYADRYRSAFLFAFLLAAAAVGLALLPEATDLTPHHAAEIACIMFEFAAIVVILTLVWRGRHQRWHERWIDYRLMAELVRHRSLVAPLGGKQPFPQIPAHWTTYGQPGASWMAWYVRAIERRLGLPSAIVDAAYLDDYLSHLAKLVKRQIDYHVTNQGRCHKLENRLHNCGVALLGLTLAACATHLVLSIRHEPARLEWLPPVLTFFCGFFPALGAATAGILTQGEFRRINSRSKAMSGQLQLQLTEIENLRKKIASTPNSSRPQFSTSALALANATANLLVNEVLDWRVVFLDQPLRPPA